MSAKPPREPELAHPIRTEIEESQDLARLPAALDVIATRLARNHRWLREPDVDTEPLDSLLVRALAVVPKRARKKLEKLPEIASELAAAAAKVRYGQAAPRNVRRAEALREQLYDGLCALEAYLDE